MKLKNLLFAALSFITMSAMAQTADEIVGKNIEAMGGKDKLSSLQSLKMTGTLATQGVDVGMTFTKLNNKGFRIDLEINGMSNYQTATTNKGTVFMPIAGMTSPADMEPSQLKSMVRQMDLQGPLFNYKEKGTTIDVLGKEMVDGSEAYKLKLNYKDGESSTYFIDTKTNRLVKSVAKRTFNGVETELETTYADYKQNADGYWFPYSITSQQGTTVIDKIETNVKIDESIFN
jgi:hypothetical protein